VPGRAHQEISPRRACILAAIVEEYVETAAPVGSKAVRERRALDVSTATIRNEMGVLERAGYIRQPHTSAGRIPVDKGYRAYVDAIEAPSSPREEQAAWVRSEYRHLARRDPEEIYRTTSRVLSQLTAAPAMVMAPPDEEARLVDLKLSPVSSRNFLLSYQITPGGSFTCLLESPEPVLAGQAERLSEALRSRYCGRSVGALSQCAADLLEDDTVPYAVPEALLDSIKTAVEGDRLQRVYVDGAVYALDYPEYQDVGLLRPVVEALDEEMVIRRLLRPSARRGQLTVTIGVEQGMRSLRHCALVASHYVGADDDVGALGVIGPTRLDYQAVIAAVRYVAAQLSELLTRESERES
jgi:heat-inducible transcriptional repressor